MTLMEKTSFKKIIFLRSFISKQKNGCTAENVPTWYNNVIKVKEAYTMKKIHANVNENDRIMIKRVDYRTIQYVHMEARTGKKQSLGDPIRFSPSVKNYFGEQGRTIRQLYDFHEWHNEKLQIELNRIWRLLDNKNCKQNAHTYGTHKKRKQHKNKYFETYDEAAIF